MGTTRPGSSPGFGTNNNNKGLAKKLIPFLLVLGGFGQHLVNIFQKTFHLTYCIPFVDIIDGIVATEHLHC